ncbi:MAG: AAA family ATPase, partial [Egibacteraceae bacterium]
CVVVAGLPAAGKSMLGHRLAARLGGAVIDKDTVTAPLVAAALAAAGEPLDELDAPFYKRRLRPAVYAAVEATTADVLADGATAVLVAPYLVEVTDPTWQPALRKRLGAARLDLVWVVVDTVTARARIAARDLPRDRQSLRHWPRFAEQFAGLRPPAGPHVTVDTSGLAATELNTVVDRLAAELAEVSG